MKTLNEIIIRRMYRRPKHILFYDYYIVFENEFYHRYGYKKAPVKTTGAKTLIDLIEHYTAIELRRGAPEDAVFKQEPSF